MKVRVIVVVAFLIANFANAQMANELMSRNGWVVFWKDAAIWLPAEINKNVKNKDFFKQADVYKNGLLINYIPEALLYKSIAQLYVVQANRKGYKASDSVWIIPVLVKYKTGFKSDPDFTDISLLHGENEIKIEFRGNADYDIREIELLRNSDKKKLKKLKYYQTYPPH